MAISPPHCCSVCFFTTAFPGVRIERDGRCSECHSADIPARMASHRKGGLDELRRLLDEARAGTTSRYDCIVGASGGLDSSYTLYIAVKLLGLKPLVIHYDHGLNHDRARRNLDALCRDLGVELVVVRSKGRHDLKFVRHVMLALGDVGLYWGICTFCNVAMKAVIWRSAKREGIAGAFGSDNHYESTLHLDRAPKLAAMKRALRRTSPLRWPAMAWHVAAAAYHLLRLRMELYVPPLSNLVARKPRIDGPRYLTVSRYVEWDVPQMVATLERETGWRAPFPALPMRFDCMLEDSIINRTWSTVTGLTVHGVIASNLVHAGLRTRDELAATVRQYDEVMAGRQREVEARLGIRPRSGGGAD